MTSQKRILVALLILTMHVVAAQAQQQPIGRNDHLFSGRGRSMVTLATGIPYIGVAEYAYGISDRFSLGLIVGQTPKIAGYGLRIRGIVFQKNESFRMFVRAPILYYPQTKKLGGEPWFLTWPVVGGEWKLRSGVRLSVGGGFVAAACANDLLGLATAKHSPDAHATANYEHERQHHHEDSDDSGFMGGLWNTFHVGAAIPLSNRIVLQSEISVVMSGTKIAGQDWVGGPPVILVLGFSYVL